MTWTSLSDTGAAMSTRELSLDDQDMIVDTLDAAVEWQEGRMAWHDAARIGAIEFNGSPSAAYSRFLALTSTPKADPRWQALRALVDRLIRASGFVLTVQGTYSPQELGQHQAAVHVAQQDRRAA